MFKVILCKFLKKPTYLLKRIFYGFSFQINKLINKSYSKSYYGPVFKGNYSDNTYKYYITGSYGDFLSDLLIKDKTINMFFDIGANQGLYTILASKNENITKVFSFEPNSKIFNFLINNLESNFTSAKVSSFELGISDFKGFVDLIVPIGHSGAGQIVNKHEINSTIKNNNSSIERIQVVDYCWLNDNLKIEENDKIGIKIDVEGHELIVIESLRLSTFWNNVVWLFFEVNHLKFDSLLLLEKLKSDGFSEINKISKDENQYDLFVIRNLDPII
jgi:FkbM family methyltransferase